MTEDQDKNFLLNECRQVLDNQVNYMIETDKEAFKLLRINLAAVGLVISAFALARSSSIKIAPFLNIYALLGLSALILALSFSAVTYLRTRVSMGLSDPEITNFCSKSMGEVYDEIVKKHSSYIAENNKDLKRNKEYLQLARYFVLIEIIFLIITVMDGVLGNLDQATIFGKNGIYPVYSIFAALISAKLASVLQIIQVISDYADRNNTLLAKALYPIALSIAFIKEIMKKLNAEIQDKINVIKWV